MSKLSVIKNISLIIALVAIIYLAGNYGEALKNQALAMLHIPVNDVKGVSTEKAKEISDKFKSDIGEQVGILEGQVLNLRVSDALTLITRMNKIPQDVHSAQQYLNEQIGSVLKSKK